LVLIIYVLFRSNSRQNAGISPRPEVGTGLILHDESRFVQKLVVTRYFAGDPSKIGAMFFGTGSQLIGKYEKEGRRLAATGGHECLLCWGEKRDEFHSARVSNPEITCNGAAIIIGQPPEFCPQGFCAGRNGFRAAV